MKYSRFASWALAAGIGLLSLSASQTAEAKELNIDWSQVKCVNIPARIRVLAYAGSDVANLLNESLEDGDDPALVQEAIETLQDIQEEILKGVQHYIEGNCL